jgi:hypothetical protein
MKLLAAVFAGIALLAAVLGFMLNVLPILSLLGRLAASAAFAGLVLTLIAYSLEELIPPVEFGAGDIHV